MIQLQLTLGLPGRYDPRKRPYGHTLRALFLRWVKAYDPGLAAWLHADAPYALQAWRGRRQTLRCGVTIFHEAVGNDLLPVVTAKAGTGVTLGGMNYQVQEVGVRRVLEDPGKLLVLPAAIKFELEFRTPTYFRALNKKSDVRLPVPVTVATNLAHLWNQISHGKAEIDVEGLREWVEENVTESSFTLETRAWAAGGQRRVIGIVGRCRYIARPDPNWGKWLSILGAMAEYTNVGGGRTAGFGVVGFKLLEASS